MYSQVEVLSVLEYQHHTTRFDGWSNDQQNGVHDFIRYSKCEYEKCEKWENVLGYSIYKKLILIILKFSGIHINQSINQSINQPINLMNRVTVGMIDTEVIQCINPHASTIKTKTRNEGSFEVFDKWTNEVFQSTKRFLVLWFVDSEFGIETVQKLYTA